MDYVGDGINGHRLDLYYPIGMEINLNNIGVLALNKQYEELNKIVKDLQKKKNIPVLLLFMEVPGEVIQERWVTSPYQGFIKKLLNNDFIIATLNHRSSNTHAFPAQLHDVKAAIRFLKGNSEALNIDPNFIVIQGYSSGGHLCFFDGSDIWFE